MKKYHLTLPLILLFAGALLYFYPTSSDRPAFSKKKDVFDDVHINMQIGDIEEKVLMDKPYTFVYFNYTIDNQHQDPLLFHPGHIRVNYNGSVNTSTEYNSLASAMTEAAELPRGVSDYSLYLVFDQHNISKTIKVLDIQETGISKDVRR